MKNPNRKLIFKVPPENWEQFLPLGNGRLGAMVKAHPCNETIQLNEEGIWSGGPQDRINASAKQSLNKIRKLVKEGNVLDAQEMGFENLSGTDFNERVYQTAGEFKIDFFEEKNFGIECGWPLSHKIQQVYLDTYESSLNLEEASVTVTYKDSEGVIYTRTVWISAPDNMLFMKVTASEKGKINFRGYLDRGIWADAIYSEDGFIFLEDAHGIPFCAGAGVAAQGGSVSTTGFCLNGSKCDTALFFIDIQAFNWAEKCGKIKGKPDFKRMTKAEYDKMIAKCGGAAESKKRCRSNLEKTAKHIQKTGVEEACKEYFDRHLEEYKSYFNRMSLSIGSHDKATENVTTPELLKACTKQSTDLVELYANFDRYLLIAGSRKPGLLPTTLQGLWNCYMDPPWGSKYTININTQMNYWPVNMTNLCECEIPMFDLLERAYENGCRTAKVMYGCSGYVLHHNTDYWGDSAPQDAWLPGTYWVLGAAWMATHIYEHYEYTLDMKCLARYYYLMHEACRFFVDFLQPCELKAEDGNPYLVINPSVSPENSYVTKTGQVGAFTEGCEMDNMILEHLFKSCLRARIILGDKARNKYGKKYLGAEFEQFEYVLKHLKAPELNGDGSLMEWNTEVPEVEPGHRHVSHLYGLYPGHTISVEKTPELAEAAKKTLEKRLKNGGGHTGWSQAWIINFRAQLEQGDEALEAIEKILTHSTLPNLLDNHPPFQIDGNYGALAAIIRMLVQSEIGEDGNVHVKLLPALPSDPAWKKGSVSGVRIKGDYICNFTWKNGKPDKVEFIPGPNADKNAKVIY